MLRKKRRKSRRIKNRSLDEEDVKEELRNEEEEEDDTGLRFSFLVFTRKPFSSSCFVLETPQG